MSTAVLATVVMLGQVACSQPAPAPVDPETIIALERQALDRYALGETSAYAMHAADDVTYMDANVAMLEGAEAFRAYAASLEGQVPPHSYVLDNPRVQVYGDVAILTFQWLASDTTGAPMAHWHATSVYRLAGDAWQLVHGHWSPFGAE